MEILPQSNACFMVFDLVAFSRFSHAHSGQHARRPGIVQCAPEKQANGVFALSQLGCGESGNKTRIMEYSVNMSFRMLQSHFPATGIEINRGSMPSSRIFVSAFLFEFFTGIQRLDILPVAVKAQSQVA